MTAGGGGGGITSIRTKNKLESINATASVECRE
jgi:hypothetical protein